LFASLCAVSKLPFFMTAESLYFPMVVINRSGSCGLGCLLAGTGMVAAEFLREDPIIGRAFQRTPNIPMLKLRLAHNPFIRDWFFGDWKFRMNPGVWNQRRLAVAAATLGSLPFVVRLLTALLPARQPVPQVVAGSHSANNGGIYASHIVHWHYYLIELLPVAVRAETTLAAWENLWALAMPRPAALSLARAWHWCFPPLTD